MKNKQVNVGSFATAKLQAKRRSLLAIIALAALIGFSMIVTLASCGNDSGGPGGYNPSGGGGGGGGNSGAWPPNSVLSQWGLSGMPAPAGATNFEWVSATNSSLYIDFAGTSATDAAAQQWLTNNGWTLDWEANDYKVYQKAPFQAFYRWDQNDSHGRSRELFVWYL